MLAQLTPAADRVASVNWLVTVEAEMPVQRCVTTPVSLLNT